MRRCWVWCIALLTYLLFATFSAYQLLTLNGNSRIAGHWSSPFFFLFIGDSDGKCDRWIVDTSAGLSSWRFYTQSLVVSWRGSLKNRPWPSPTCRFVKFPSFTKDKLSGAWAHHRMNRRCSGEKDSATSNQLALQKCCLIFARNSSLSSSNFTPDFFTFHL